MTTKSCILIVDDIPENIKLLGAVLRREDRLITVAQNGEQALQQIQKQVPDLILLDVMMPKLDGFQVCEALKADPKTADVEVIFITADTASTAEMKGLNLGAVDYIHKPFSVDLVQTKVALHLERVHRNKDLKLQNAMLEENARLRENIARMTQQDLKKPLNTILGYPLIMMDDENLTQDQRVCLEEIVKAGKDMLNMINASLDLVKIENGNYECMPVWVDMSGLIHSVTKDLNDLVEQQKVKIHISFEFSHPLHTGKAGEFLVMAEKNLCYSVFANLIRNAVEASAANDTVRIVMKYEGDYGVVAITNSGSVPETIRDTFFAKRVTPGKTSGVGLYSAKLMTEVQHGHIAMHTDDLRTTLTVSFPYQKALQTVD